MDNNQSRTLFVNSNVYLPGEGGYKRTMYLFDMMKRLGYNVTLLTSDFNHYNKSARNIVEFRKHYPEYNEIEFIHIWPYKKNISIKRYISEKQTAYLTIKYIKRNIDRFNVIYLNMPNMDTIISIRDLCTKHNVKMIVDVRDLRPEVFRVIVRNEKLYNVLFHGMKLKADKAYACADELIAVSQEYLDRALESNTRAKNPGVVYIGSALKKFDAGVKKYADEIKKPENELWLTYAGTIGTSYDLDTLLSAAKVLQDQPNNKVRVKILGQGPDKEKLLQRTRDEMISIVDFIGFVPYENMAAYLSRSDMTINSIKKNASQSIINKVADYFAAGIPMINGCSCKEQQEMVDKYQIGMNYEPENVESLVYVINILSTDKNKRDTLGANARMLAEEKFDRDRSYFEIIRRIEAATKM